MVEQVLFVLQQLFGEPVAVIACDCVGAKLAVAVPFVCNPAEGAETLEGGADLLETEGTPDVVVFVGLGPRGPFLELDADAEGALGADEGWLFTPVVLPVSLLRTLPVA
jgi:hypothetical protein